MKNVLLFTLLLSFLSVVSAGNVTPSAQSKEKKILEVCQKYVGTQEVTNMNDGAFFDYVRAVSSPHFNTMRDERGKQLATCGFTVNAMFREAGYEIKVKNLERAKSYLQCPNGVQLGRFANVSKLKPEMVVIYAPLKGWFSGYHVGILNEALPFNMTVYEANTSTFATVLKVKSKKDGFYLKIRPYSVAYMATDCKACSVQSDTVSLMKLRKKYLHGKSTKNW